MNYKFQVGDLVELGTVDVEGLLSLDIELRTVIGLVTARSPFGHGDDGRTVHGRLTYTILIENSLVDVDEENLTKVSENNEL